MICDGYDFAPLFILIVLGIIAMELYTIKHMVDDRLNDLMEFIMDENDRLRMELEHRDPEI